LGIIITVRFKLQVNKKDTAIPAIARWQRRPYWIFKKAKPPNFVHPLKIFISGTYLLKTITKKVHTPKPPYVGVPVLLPIPTFFGVN
jgi:hypothetical protein